MRTNCCKSLLLFLLFSLNTSIFSQDFKYPYQNPNLPIDYRVKYLISRLTLKEKVDQLISVVEKLRSKIQEMESENADLKTVMSKLQKQHQTLQLENADRADTVRTKLDRVINRLEELENLAD